MLEHATPVSPSRRATTIGMLLFAAVVIAGLLWAKWLPYTEKVQLLSQTAQWDGHSILDRAGPPGSTPSLRGGWAFTVAYAAAVWKALVVALVVAAAIEALVPRRWFLRLLRVRDRRRGTVIGGLLALPCMMCTCCTAPIVVTMRRNQVPASTAAAYWLGNPTLNPAVIAFLALVAPWQWAATRVVVGMLLVFGFTALLTRFDRTAAVPSADEVATEPPVTPVQALRRFARTLLKMSMTLVPEYLIVVFALGAFRGWLLPFEGTPAQWGAAAVVVAAILGTLIVIPTAGEVPILQALVLAGAGAGVVGALLICLPAVSLVSIVMVGRALSWRLTAIVAAAVVAAGGVAGAMLAVLT